MTATRYTPFAEHFPAGVGSQRKEASTTVGMRQAAEGSYVRYEELVKAEAKIRSLEQKLAKASKMVADYVQKSKKAAV